MYCFPKGGKVIHICAAAIRLRWFDAAMRFVVHVVDGKNGRLVVIDKELRRRLRLDLGIQGTKQDPILDGVLRQYCSVVIAAGDFLTTALGMSICRMDNL